MGPTDLGVATSAVESPASTGPQYPIHFEEPWRRSLDVSEAACAWVGPCGLGRMVSSDVASNMNFTEAGSTATT